MEERTGWREQNESQIGGKEMRNGRLFSSLLYWCCRDQQRACRIVQASAEKFEQTGPAEKERVASVPQREQLTHTPEPPLPKEEGTEPSVESTRS